MYTYFYTYSHKRNFILLVLYDFIIVIIILCVKDVNTMMVHNNDDNEKKRIKFGKINKNIKMILHVYDVMK